jgi:hypothetical protein
MIFILVPRVYKVLAAIMAPDSVGQLCVQCTKIAWLSVPLSLDNYCRPCSIYVQERINNGRPLWHRLNHLPHPFRRGLHGSGYHGAAAICCSRKPPIGQYISSAYHLRLSTTRAQFRVSISETADGRHAEAAGVQGSEAEALGLLGLRDPPPTPVNFSSCSEVAAFFSLP